jgi:hypothetical protein
LPSPEGSNLHAYKTSPRRSKRFIHTKPLVCDSVGLGSCRHPQSTSCDADFKAATLTFLRGD